MGRFLKAMLAGHPALPSAELLKEMRRAQPGAPRYGLGLMVGASGSDDVVHHAGQTPGFDALVAWRPERGLGIAVMTNAGPSRLFGTTAAITYGIASTVLGDVPDVPATTPLIDVLAVVGLLALGVVALLLGWRQRRGYASQRWRWTAAMFGTGMLAAAGALFFALPAVMGVTHQAIWLFQPDTLVMLAGVSAALASAGVTLLAGASRGLRQDKPSLH
jgi:hypothetical protein